EAVLADALGERPGDVAGAAGDVQDGGGRPGGASGSGQAEPAAGHGVFGGGVGADRPAFGDVEADGPPDPFVDLRQERRFHRRLEPGRRGLRGRPGQVEVARGGVGFVRGLFEQPEEAFQSVPRRRLAHSLIRPSVNSVSWSGPGRSSPVCAAMKDSVSAMRSTERLTERAAWPTSDSLRSRIGASEAVACWRAAHILRACSGSTRVSLANVVNSTAG